jgi:hypothetical protein
MNSDRIPEKILKYQPKGESSLGKPRTMEGLCFVISVTGLNRLNTRKDDDDDDDLYLNNKLTTASYFLVLFLYVSTMDVRNWPVRLELYQYMKINTAFHSCVKSDIKP